MDLDGLHWKLFNGSKPFYNKGMYNTNGSLHPAASVVEIVRTMQNRTSSAAGDILRDILRNFLEILEDFLP